MAPTPQDAMAAVSQVVFKLGKVVSVRNTFLHISSDEEDEQLCIRRATARAKTQPIPSTFSDDGQSEEGDDDSSEDDAGEMGAPRMLPSKSAPAPSPAMPGALSRAAAIPALSSRGSGSSCEVVARGLTLRRQEGGAMRLEWSVDERRVSGMDRMFVSPGFQLELPGLGQLPFKLILRPAGAASGVGGGKQTFGKLAQGFKSAEGWARVELKSCGDSPAGAASSLVDMSIGIGSGELAQPMRGPVLHDLSTQSCCGLPQGADAWHLPSAVDASSRRLLVSVLVTPRPGLSEEAPGMICCSV